MALRIAPGAKGKMGLATSFRKELLRAEVMFNGDLGEQEAAMGSPRNQQAMAANFDLFGKNRNRSGEQRYFDVQVVEFLGSHRREARILQCRTGRRPYNTIRKRFAGFHHADAAAQTPANVKRHENAAAL